MCYDCLPPDAGLEISVQDLIVVAASLVGDGAGNDLGDNSEYERGIAELIARSAGLEPADVLARVHEAARALKL